MTILPPLVTSVPSALAGVLPALVTAYQSLVRAGYAGGYLVTPSLAIADYGGFRSLAQTIQILQFRADDYAHDLKLGIIQPRTLSLDAYRPITAFGSSYHNYGAAFDVEASNVTLSALGELAPHCGLRWGGTFETNKDRPHFELAITLEEATDAYIQFMKDGV